MRDVERRKLEKFERQQAFMQDNAADFLGGSPGDKAANENTAIIDEMRTLAAQQISGGGSAHQSIGNKDEMLDELMLMIRNINRAANAFEDEVPGSNLKFRLPRNRSQQNIVATARSFHTDATPLKLKFIEYGLEGSFLDDLQSAIDDFDAAGTSADSGEEQRAAATGGLIDAARRGMNNSRKLDAIVRIKYTNNPQKLAAWTVASHLDRAPKPKPNNNNGGTTPPTP